MFVSFVLATSMGPFLPTKSSHTLMSSFVFKWLLGTLSRTHSRLVYPLSHLTHSSHFARLGAYLPTFLPTYLPQCFKVTQLFRGSKMHRSPPPADRKHPGWTLRPSRVYIDIHVYIYIYIRYIYIYTYIYT